MDRYFIHMEKEGGYTVEAFFSDGSNTRAGGFSSEEEAEQWVEERRRERKRLQR